MVLTLQMIFNFMPKQDSVKLCYRLSSVYYSAVTSRCSAKESHHWISKTNRSFHNSVILQDLFKHPNRLSSNTLPPSNGLVRVDARMFAGEAKNTGLQLQDSAESLLFDEGGILIKKVTFKEAKSLARSKNCRLVYMNKNKDGINCFKLEPFKIATQPVPKPTYKPNDNAQSIATKETVEDSPKEFKIKHNIKEHDLLIKTNKIKSLLSKGKSVIVTIQHAASEDANVNQSLAKKLTEEFKSSGRLKNESIGKGSTRFTITPVEKSSS